MIRMAEQESVTHLLITYLLSDSLYTDLLGERIVEVGRARVVV